MSSESAPRVAVMGSVAYDVIGKTDKVFDRAGPGLNCKVTSQQEFFGGCAGNIVYGLRQLEVSSLLLAIAGSEDFRRYAQHLDHNLSGMLLVRGAYCAKANIITDPNGVQFTAFSPGPQVSADDWSGHLGDQPLESADVFICAPFPEPLMQAALATAKSRNPKVLSIWVPGQYADALNKEQLTRAMASCDVLVGNAYEVGFIRQTAADCVHGKTVIETDSARPVRAVLSDGNQRTLPVPAAYPVVDPTGCGDAFVAGMVPALLSAIDSVGRANWQTKINSIVRGGTAQAAQCIVQRGSQTYKRHQLA